MVMILQLPDVSNIILQIDEEPMPYGILVLLFNELQPNYKESKINEQWIGAILDSAEGC